MFTKQNNTKQKVYKHVIFIKQKRTDKLCLQNKTKVYKHVMFIKQKVFIQVMFTKQNQMFTDKLWLQNNFFYKTKVLQHVMFIKQNIKHILLSRRVNFEPFHNFSVFHRDDFVNFT